jgi:hypothetical protein
MIDEQEVPREPQTRVNVSDGDSGFPTSSSTVSAAMTQIEGIPYPFLLTDLNEKASKDVFGRIRNLPNLIGVIGMPNCAVLDKLDNYQIEVPYVKSDGTVGTEYETIPKVVLNMGSVIRTGGTVSVPKAKTTDFYPYTYYVLTDGESEPLIMKPQLCGSSITVVSRTALSHTPVERYYPSYYAGSTNGTVYNITSTGVSMLPFGKNDGMAQLSANAASLNNQVRAAKLQRATGVIAGAMSGASNGAVQGSLAMPGPGTAIGAGIGAATGALQGFIAGDQAVKAIDAKMTDLELTPSSIGSLGTPSTRQEFGTQNIRILKYQIPSKSIQKIEDYISRFGNKFHQYATINHKTARGYHKFVAPDIDANIDYMYLTQISTILQRGVYFE